MDGFRAIGFLLLLTFSCIYAKPYWKRIVPEGKEIVYEYKALVKAGTHIPHPFASQFWLNGKLHLQLGSSNELLVRLDNLQYKLDNGREAEIRKSTMQNSNLAHITKPFKIVYEDNGAMKEMITEDNEPEYSLNMKKAIAAMLQMNWEKIPLDSVKPFAFSTKEKSLFGVHETLYNVMPKSNVLNIYRMHYMSTPGHIYNNLMTDIKQLGCDAAYEDPITHDTQKLYIIDRNNPDQYRLKYMESNGGVYFQPSQGKSSAFYVYVNQTFTMLEMIEKKVPMTIEKETKHTTLDYVLSENSVPFETVPDHKRFIPMIENMLSDLVEFLKQDKISPTEPDMAKGQLVNRIVKVLSHLDITMLDGLYTKLAAKTDEKDLLSLELFQQMVPMVGTRNSLKFILKLVQENKIKEQVLIDMLQNMPFYVRIPTIQLLTELDGLLNLGSSPWLVQKAAILSYSTLLSKLNEFNLRQGIETTQIIKKYIEQFINKIKTSKKLEDQYMYLDALFNMNNDLVIKYLEPLVKGEWFSDNRLRYKAMMSLASVITKHTHHDKMYELYWPIMTDTTLPTYMRILSFYIVMKSKPSLSCQINLYSFMQHEKDVDFLNFYYTYLRSLMESKNPCLYRSKLQARQLLLYWPISYAHSITQFQKIDMTNWEYNYGQSHDFALVNTKDAIIFMWKMDINAMNLQTNPSSFYIKIMGMDRRLLDSIYLNTKKGMKFLNYDELWNVLALTNYENLHVEMIHMRNGQIVENRLFDKNTIASMSTSFKMLYEKQFSENKKMLQIHYDMVIKMLLPTDIGFPVQFEMLMPSIHETKSKLFKEETNKITNINIDNKYRIMNYFTYGLSFHNPFVAVWQGVSKYMYLDTELPIYLGLSLNPQQSTLKLSWKRHEDRSKDVIGYRSFAATYIYVIDYLENNMLQTITPAAKNFVSVSHNDNYKHNISLIDTEEYNIGYNYMLRVFNDENPKYYQRFPLLQDFFSGMEPWSQKLMKYALYTEYMQFQHGVTERGIMLRLEPSTTNPVTNIDITMRLNTELTDEGYSLYLPAMKINAKVAYAIKKEEKVLKTWDVNGVWDLNNQHTSNSMKLDITRTIPGQNDYKICIHGTENYGKKDLTGHMSITMSQSADGKCNKDETLIQLTMKANQLPEQERRLNNFDVCHQAITPLIEEMRPYKCYADRSSLRYYTVDVKTTNFPKLFKNTVVNYWRMFLRTYQEHYMHLDVSSEDITENNLKIQWRYPISKDTVDVRFITPTDTHKFKSIPATDFSRFGIYPDNSYYSNVHHMLHMLGLTNICTVDGTDLITIERNRLSDVITNDWTLILGDAASSTQRGLWIKLIAGKLAMKSVLQSQTLLVMPTENSYTITLDGKEIEFENMYHHNFIITKMEDSNTLVGFNRYTGAHVIYNGHQLLIEIPKTDLKFAGKCIPTK